MEHRAFPFGGVPVYNPQSLSKEEALAQFHVRKVPYEHLLALLRQDRPPHVLIIGTRGMGKTTLLQRIRYGVEDDLDLNSRYLPLVFPEEQYNVNRLDRFLLNTVDAVADAIERLDDKPTLVRVEAFAESIARRGSAEITDRVPQFLREFSQRTGKALLLLVDNADRLFETIEEKQQWRLRDLLSSDGRLTFFGATTQASEGVYNSERAFFEFFQIQTLAPLTSSEVRTLLVRLSESVVEQESGKGAAKRRVLEWLAADGARLRTLVQLTGGNPRTTVLLFHLVLDGLQGGAREYLEQLLDQVTPNYKGRVDELSPQAQQVLDAVALHWDPVTANEAAVESGLDTGVVSTHLTRLVRQGILEKAEAGDRKKALYQVAERFFNIWYLMRASRRVRAKLRWFVEFLRVFFDDGELERIGWDRVEQNRTQWQSDPGEVETTFAYFLASGVKRNRIEEYLRRHCPEMEQVWKPYLELLPPPAEQGAPPPEGDDERSEAAIRAMLQSDPADAERWSQLAAILSQDASRFAEAERAFRRATELDPSWASPWCGLAKLLAETGRLSESEVALETAIELNPNWALPLFIRGTICASTGRAVEAECAFQEALRLDPDSAQYWLRLAELLAGAPDRVLDAEHAFQQATRLSPKWGDAWLGLGRFLASLRGREQEAELAIRRAISISPNWSGYWAALAELLNGVDGHEAEVEDAATRAVSLAPDRADYWQQLSFMLSGLPGRLAEAEAAIRKAVTLAPEDANTWRTFGFFMACRASDTETAETAFRTALRLNPNDAIATYNLGVLLYCAANRIASGIEHLERACELAPNNAVFAAVALAAKPGDQRLDSQILDLASLRDAEFWNKLFTLCRNYSPFGKLLIRICDLVRRVDPSNAYEKVFRALAYSQLGEFPRASVAFEDALTGDPIEFLGSGRATTEAILAAAVRHGRARDFREILEKKGWKDAWRPIFEALRAAEAGTAEHLKRVAVEVRAPATEILRRIAPALPRHNADRTK